MAKLQYVPWNAQFGDSVSCMVLQGDSFDLSRRRVVVSVQIRACDDDAGVREGGFHEFMAS